MQRLVSKTRRGRWGVVQGTGRRSTGEVGRQQVRSEREAGVLARVGLCRLWAEVGILFRA